MGEEPLWAPQGAGSEEQEVDSHLLLEKQEVHLQASGHFYRTTTIKCMIFRIINMLS